VPIRKAYIRHREAYPDSPNTFAAWEGFNTLAVETAPYYGFGDIDALSDLGPEVCLVGFIGDVWQALEKLHVPRPTPIDYPHELQYLVGRSIIQSTLGEVRRLTRRLFVKPVEHKVFTGFVWEASKADRIRIATYGDDVPVWISDEVEFVSEYRCFVLDREILGVRLYRGDWAKAPDRGIVEGAVKTYLSSPRAYALDFGVTDDGRTLLVEANEGFALGHYGLNSVLYARLIEARWGELTSDISCHNGAEGSV
jgi:hypothetical protein